MTQTYLDHVQQRLSPQELGTCQIEILQQNIANLYTDHEAQKRKENYSAFSIDL
jgi:hypothetical protein